jgi:ribosomal protein S18 acetylase RimI-like enzyme
MIEIRKLKPEDLPRLYEIECECFDEVVRWDEGPFYSILKAHDTWVAEFVEDGCECGQVWNCICNDTPKETREIAGFLVSTVKYGKGYIESVDISKEYRRKGIGAKLMVAAEEHYTEMGLKKIYLEVQTDNPAQTLYFKLGYRATKVIEKFYDDGSGCLVMTKSLDLLERMNTPANRRAMRSAFAATPSELGRAAVTQAKIS